MPHHLAAAPGSEVTAEETTTCASWDDDEPTHGPTKPVKALRSDEHASRALQCPPHICGRCGAAYGAGQPNPICAGCGQPIHPGQPSRTSYALGRLPELVHTTCPDPE